MRKHYLIISISCCAPLIIWILLMWGCASQGPVCRHNVVGDALFLGEHYDHVEIAVDPTVAKHAQARYRVNDRWRWYCETVEGWTPEYFNPVLFFDIEGYIEWYVANHHNKQE